MTFGKAKKKTTIVGYQQLNTGDAGDYGVLGSLVSGDVILTSAAGTLATMSSSDFSTKYEAASSTSSLTGTELD